jgi:hypothetical protein
LTVLWLRQKPFRSCTCILITAAREADLVDDEQVGPQPVCR